MKKLYFLFFALLITASSFGQIVINEIDADTPGTDVAEFIELKWTPSTALDGLSVVLFNGSDDLSYSAYDLDGYNTDANGFFILGNTALSPDIVLPSNGVQNGADAVAVYQANATDFPNDTPITLTNLIDVVIYSTGDPDDAGLLAGFGVTVQYDESANGLKDTESLQRTDDGASYETKAPTYRADNYSTDPTLSLSDGPVNGDTLIANPETATPGIANIDFATTNFTMSNETSPGSGVSDGSGDGFITWSVENTSGSVFVDGGNIFTSNNTSITYPVTGLVNGETYFFTSELVANNGASLVPAVTYSFTFTIASYTVVPDLAALRASTIGDDLYYQVSGEVIGTFMQNNRNQKYIQDTTAGILIDDPNFNIATVYNIGDGVENIKGQLSSFNGVLQFIPVEDAAEVPVSSTGNVITPEVVTITELLSNWENYESELVEIKGATFVGATGNFATGTDYPINDGASDLNFRTNFFDANYIGSLIPTIPQDLVVLVAEFNGTPQVTARDLADVTLRIDRDAINGFNLYPNPVTNGKLFINTLNNADKEIQIYNILGKQVLSTKLKGSELNVSKLGSGIYILKILEEGKTATRKLVIK